MSRQAGYDTEVNHNSVVDLHRVRSWTDKTILCRINANANTNTNSCMQEIDQAIDGGADELLLPMIRTVAEVEAVLEYVNNRGKLGILVETMDAVALAPELARLPLSRVYLGLNDLAIDKKCTNIFAALQDGTVERVRGHFQIPFGFAGLTLPEMGHPIACGLLINEMARLHCSFSFLRRSFHADIQGKDISLEIPRISQAVIAAFKSSRQQQLDHHHELIERIQQISTQERGPS